MYIDATHDGWKRVATGLDIELKHGVPVILLRTKDNNWIKKIFLTRFMN